MTGRTEMSKLLCKINWIYFFHFFHFCLIKLFALYKIGKLVHQNYVVLCNDRTRRSWKPNVQEKRLFSYILDRHIRVKVTTHALRCIDKAGGIDEYLLKTPYSKMDTEMGLFWKAKIEKLYEELGQKEVVFFSPEDETKFEQEFKELRLNEKAAQKEARKQMFGWSGKLKQMEEGEAKNEETKEEATEYCPVTYIPAASRVVPGHKVYNF